VPKKKLYPRYIRIYTIRDSFGAVRYVGKTSTAVIERLKQHKNARSVVGRWIRDELSQGNAVTVHQEEEFVWYIGDKSHGPVSSQACEAERAYIKGYSNLLHDKLLNVYQHPKRSLLRVG